MYPVLIGLTFHKGLHSVPASTTQGPSEQKPTYSPYTIPSSRTAAAASYLYETLRASPESSLVRFEINKCWYKFHAIN